MEVRPFRVAIPEDRLADLRERVARTRFPDGFFVDGWEEGTDTGFVRELCAYWAAGFDWRRVEEEINALPNAIAAVGGLDVHFVHARGKGPRPFPLLVTHGWPGSFLEMSKLTPLLSDPGAHGGDPKDAFDVVVPSLPGYGFSEKPQVPGTHPGRIAGLWAELAAGLGYERFGAQGGDWGASVTTWLARRHPDRVAGIHLNYIPGSYAPYIGPGARPPSGEEEAFLEERDRWLEEEGAYARIQATRPRTLAFALSDSPVGLLAWLVEKYRNWSDCGGDVLSRFSRDELLAQATLYWVTGTIGSSIRLYREAKAAPLVFGKGEWVPAPCGVARFPKEAPMPPRAWVERAYDVVRWTEMPRGGHFAAMEEPELLAQDIREFFRPLR